jgi:hypothetical protein
MHNHMVKLRTVFMIMAIRQAFAAAAGGVR